MSPPLPLEPETVVPIVWPLVAGASFLGAFFVSWLLTPVTGRLGAALGLLDAPNAARKVHAQVTPRSGGIAVAAAFFGVVGGGFLVASLLPRLPLGSDLATGLGALLKNLAEVRAPILATLGGAALLFVVGLVDDRRPLPPIPKLLLQVAAGALLWWCGVRARAFLPDPVALAVTIAWVVVIVNAFNFLDNMDGLSSGVAALTAGGFVLMAYLAREWLQMATWAALAGAAAGFWRWNFWRGKPFLGDGGALMIGFLFAALSLRSTYYSPGVPTGLPVLTPLILLALPLFDSATVMFIRLREGRPLMQGDRCHLSHRLEALGMTRRGAVASHYLIVAALILIAWALRTAPFGSALGLLGVVVLLFLFLFLLERAAAARVGLPLKDASGEVSGNTPDEAPHR